VGGILGERFGVKKEGEEGEEKGNLVEKEIGVKIFIK